MEDRDGVALAGEIADGLDRLQAEHEHEQWRCHEPDVDRRCSKNASGSENADTRIHVPPAKKPTDRRRRRSGVAHIAFTHAGRAAIAVASSSSSERGRGGIA